MTQQLKAILKEMQCDPYNPVLPSNRAMALLKQER